MNPAQDKNRNVLVVGINDLFLGGAQRLVVDVLNQHTFANSQVHLITFISNSAREELLRELPTQVKHHRVEFHNLFDFRGWCRLYKTLSHIRPNVVWSHFYFSNTVFRLLKLFFGYRVIVVEHNTYTWKTFIQRVTDWALAHVTYKIVAVSDSVALFTAAQEHISPDKFLVIQNGVDVERLTLGIEDIGANAAKLALGVPSDRKYVINVARLSSQKNHKLLIEAFSVFFKQNFGYDLLIVGAGPERHALEQLVDRFKLSGHVHFLGARMDVGLCYRAADFFVLTSHIEGFALVCIEAMSFGLPVISTRVAGPDSYIIDGENGYLTSFDAQEIADNMYALATSSDLENMRLSAKRTADNYTIDKTADAYSNLFWVK